MDIEPRIWVLIAGFALGLIAGFAARASAFCTLGAIADAVVTGNQRRLRGWALALAVALLGSQGLQHFGVVDLGHSIYLSAPFNGALALVGGLLFGLGMTLVGTCGFGTLIRLGGGDLRALIDMACLGFFAYLTLSGPIAYLRIAAAGMTDWSLLGLAAPGLIELAGHLTGWSAADLRPALAAMVTGSPVSTSSATAPAMRPSCTTRSMTENSLTRVMPLPRATWVRNVLATAGPV